MFEIVPTTLGYRTSRFKESGAVGPLVFPYSNRLSECLTLQYILPYQYTNNTNHICLAKPGPFHFQINLPGYQPAPHPRSSFSVSSTSNSSTSSLAVVKRRDKSGLRQRLRMRPWPEERPRSRARSSQFRLTGAASSQLPITPWYHINPKAKISSAGWFDWPLAKSGLA